GHVQRRHCSPAGWSRLVKSLSLSLALAPLMVAAGGPALAQSHAGHAGHAPAAQAATPPAKPAHDRPMMRDGKPCPTHGAAPTGAQADPHAGHATAPAPAAQPDPHAGHDMSSHAGHGAAAADPHAGHAMASAPAAQADPHAGHDMS